MVNQFLDFLKKYGPNLGANGFDTRELPGASGSWTSQKKKIPSVESFLPTPEQTATNAEKTTAQQVDKSRTAEQSANATAQRLVASKPGETSKIDPVTDRYQEYYDKSTAALKKFNDNAFGGTNGTPSLTGGSDALAAYNSPIRGSLMTKQRQAFRLLENGSFADNANLKAEQRQKNAAQAESALADAAYKQNLSKAAIAGANVGTSAEARKAHESSVAEEYLGTRKKKKDTPIDLNDIYAMFPQ